MKVDRSNIFPQILCTDYSFIILTSLTWRAVHNAGRQTGYVCLYYNLQLVDKLTNTINVECGINTTCVCAFSVLSIQISHFLQTHLNYGLGLLQIKIFFKFLASYRKTEFDQLNWVFFQWDAARKYASLLSLKRFEYWQICLQVPTGIVNGSAWLW